MRSLASHPYLTWMGQRPMLTFLLLTDSQTSVLPGIALEYALESWVRKKKSQLRSGQVPEGASVELSMEGKQMRIVPDRRVSKPGKDMVFIPMWGSQSGWPLQEMM